MTKRKEQQPKYKQSETVVIKRSQINFAPYNPRKEDPEVIKKLKKNFKTVGYLGGIVWNQLSSYLVSGHKRVQTLDIINNYNKDSAGSSTAEKSMQHQIWFRCSEQDQSCYNL